MSIFAETKCNFSPVSTEVYTALIHQFTCRFEARQALIYQLVLGLTGENGKYNYSRAVHVYPLFFDITCSAKNYKIAPALTQGEEQPQAVEKPEETRCVDGGICPYCGGRFDAAAAVNYSTLGTQTTGPVNCPQCGKPLKIFCSVEYFCSAAEEG